MKKLWRRTVELIRSYPVLWLPVIWAGCLSYGWAHLRLIVLHDVLPAVMKQQSVLGGSVPDTSPARVGAFFILSVINTNVLQYADICGYVVALLMTAKMLGRLTDNEPDRAPYADISIASRWAGVLWVALITYVMGWGMGAVAMWPIVYYADSVHHPSIASRPYIVTPAILPVYVVLAYFVTPMALRLLSRSGKNAMGNKERSLGRLSSLLAGAAVAMLAFIQLSAPKLFYPSASVATLIGLFWAVLISLPYAPLFIALSLLGAGFIEEASPPEEVSETPAYRGPSLQSE
jgi:hypothetical protein